MRQFYYDLTIDKKPVLVPDADVTWEYSDIYSKDSGQDESGVKHNFVLRRDVRTCTFSYATMSIEEFQYLRSLFCGKTEITVTYRDELGAVQSFVAAKPTLKAAIYNAVKGYYRNLKITLSEL